MPRRHTSAAILSAFTRAGHVDLNCCASSMFALFLTVFESVQRI